MQRPLRKLYSKAFTIVELVIVIAVIGILATVVIVAYNGITASARDKTVLSDLDELNNLETRCGLHPSQCGLSGVAAVVWYSGSGTDPYLQFTPNTGNIIDVVANSTDYCIRGYNPNSATYKTLATAAIIESTPGICTTLQPSAAAYAGAGTLPPNQGVVTTLAGSGASGSANGTGTAASFNYPVDVAVDPTTGSIYVLEANNDDIRSVTTAGVVTTLSATHGAFSSAWGLTVNNSGMIFVADTYNEVIRQVTPAGVVTTFAGGSGGCSNATGTSAKFSRVIDVAADTAGNLYVADLDNDVIRMISTSASVTTLAGTCGSSGSTDGTGSGARFSAPYGIAVDASGNVYVADSGNNKIRKITPGGVVTTLAGSGTAGYANGTGTAAQFSNPDSVAVDSAGNVYVSDSGNKRIRMITSAGVVTTLAGSGTAGSGNGTGASAQFSSFISGIAVSSAGVVYVADTGNNLIRQIK